MTIAATTNLSELAAFRADDTVVEIIPQFTLPQPVRLHTLMHQHSKKSNRSIGPWQAGMPTSVPLWLACHLQTKRLCTLVLPAWLTVQNLVTMLDHERREPTLWPTTGITAFSTTSTNTDDEALRLPFAYYQIAQRMASALPPAVQLLLKDLLQVRLDKLRQQFQTLIKNTSSALPEYDDPNSNSTPPPPTVLDISGMGSMEIALLQKTFQQVLKDRDQVRQAGRRRANGKAAPPPVSSTGEEPESMDPPAEDRRRSSHRRVNLRKFRS